MQRGTCKDLQVLESRSLKECRVLERSLLFENPKRKFYYEREIFLDKERIVLPFCCGP